MSEEQRVSIPISLYKDLVRILNDVPNRKVNGYITDLELFELML